jgi:hypothetical protein
MNRLPVTLAGLTAAFVLAACSESPIGPASSSFDAALGLDAASSGTHTVTERNVGRDWHENTAAGGTVEFTTEFGAPPGFGRGALGLTTSDNSASRAQLNSDQDEGMRLADVDAVGYWTYKSSRSTGAEAHGPSINIAILYDGQEGSFTTLVFEPIYTPRFGGNAAYGEDVWREWDASGEARWWSTREIPGVCARDCFVAFDDIKAANPDAVILGYAMNLGTGNPDIIAAVDGFTGGAKTFDFEPAFDPVTSQDCMNGGWAQYGFRNQGQCIRFVNTGKDSRM